MPSVIPYNTALGEQRDRNPGPSQHIVAPRLSYPVLTSRRFQFRPFVPADIGQLVAIAGKHRIADTTVGVPHPFTNEFARMWISSHEAAWNSGKALHWAATNVGDDQLVGYAGLNDIDDERRQAELRFWVGSGVERLGYAVEWSETIVDFALMRIDLVRIYALQLERHPLAGRALASVGMQQEGLVRKRVQKGGLVEDLICWAILKEDWCRKQHH